jgi:hypothetical protein
MHQVVEACPCAKSIHELLRKAKVTTLDHDDNFFESVVHHNKAC